jgi:hypothetical protein
MSKGATESRPVGVISNPPSCITRLLSDGDDGCPLGSDAVWAASCERTLNRSTTATPPIRSKTHGPSVTTHRARRTWTASPLERMTKFADLHRIRREAGYQRIEWICATRRHHLCPLPSRAERVLRDRSHSHKEKVMSRRIAALVIVRVSLGVGSARAQEAVR